MIYCVVPEALSDELFDRLSEYYADDPGVTVIIDRRHLSARKRDSRHADAPSLARRVRRDRRRPGVLGDFAPLAMPGA